MYSFGVDIAITCAMGGRHLGESLAELIRWLDLLPPAA
jgi:hypothetical protein